MKGTANSTANTRCYETIGARVHNIAYHIHNIVDHVHVQKRYFSPNSTKLSNNIKKNNQMQQKATLALKNPSPLLPHLTHVIVVVALMLLPLYTPRMLQ